MMVFIEQNYFYNIRKLNEIFNNFIENFNRFSKIKKIIPWKINILSFISNLVVKIIEIIEKSSNKNYYYNFFVSSIYELIEKILSDSMINFHLNQIFIENLEEIEKIHKGINQIYVEFNEIKLEGNNFLKMHYFKHFSKLFRFFETKYKFYKGSLIITFNFAFVETNLDNIKFDDFKFDLSKSEKFIYLEV